MKVLVTGASGFIGSALVQHLSSSTEIQVIGMVRSKTQRPQNSNIEFRFGEICDKKNLLNLSYRFQQTSINKSMWQVSLLNFDN